MDFMLSSGSDRREKEAVARREAAKEKKRKEAALAEEQARVELQYETARKLRREEEARKAEESLRLQNEEVMLTGGLMFSSHGLQPYRIEGEDDKVVLPEAALVDLNQADAFGRGPALLRIWSSALEQDAQPSNQLEEMDVVEREQSAGGASAASHFYSHCGIREFSAQPGTIGLPDKIIQSLLARCSGGSYSPAGSESGDGEGATGEAGLLLLQTISIKYVTMPKATYVCFQPLRSAFQAVGPVKQCLEENLRYHSALSVGDLVTVWYRGTPHTLRVQRMKPGHFGTLLQTDVEVDIDTSEEYNRIPQAGKVRGRQEQEQARGVVQGAAEGAGAAAAGPFASAAAAAASTSAAVAVVFPTPVAVAEEPLELPEEPTPEEVGVVACRLRVPSGATLTRRYRFSDQLSAVFELAARSLSVRRDGIMLSTRFPPRSFDYVTIAATGQTLEQAGITESQEVFMVQVV